MDQKNNRNPESDGAPEKKSFPFVRVIITIAAIALFIFQFSKQDLREIFSIIRSLPLIALIAALVCVFFSRLAISARWNALLKINEPKPRLSETLKITFAGLFSSNVLPTSIGGDIIRLVMGIQQGLDAAYTASSLVMDRIIGFAGMFLFIPYGVYLLIQSPQNPFALNTLMLFPFAIAFKDMFKQIWEKVINFTKKVLKSIQLWLKHPKFLLESMGFNFIHMFFIFSCMWVLLDAMQSGLSLWKIGSIYSLSYVITLFPLSIGGLGVQELAISFLFTNLGDIPSENAYALALLFRIAYIIASIPGVFFLPDFQKKDKDNVEGA